MWYHARILSWNELILSNKGKVSSSRKRRGLWWAQTHDLDITSQTCNLLCHAALYHRIFDNIIYLLRCEYVELLFSCLNVYLPKNYASNVLIVIQYVTVLYSFLLLNRVTSNTHLYFYIKLIKLYEPTSNNARKTIQRTCCSAFSLCLFQNVLCDMLKLYICDIQNCYEIKVSIHLGSCISYPVIMQKYGSMQLHPLNVTD